ncbi:hypothetical protein EBBID32_10830 [Sphingobium indicum BiD32]|uniref:Uncharacterized protein n=1 Tax=Sphingobium indicum BiD32 TaxID=1301087 RepID=N1MHR2_9SPHN|nr:hypothetical protein EBBID32_10830 [Sphingobium indicum BiD32]
MSPDQPGFAPRIKRRCPGLLIGSSDRNRIACVGYLAGRAAHHRAGRHAAGCR